MGAGKCSSWEWARAISTNFLSMQCHRAILNFAKVEGAAALSASPPPTRFLYPWVASGPQKLFFIQMIVILPLFPMSDDSYLTSLFCLFQILSGSCPVSKVNGPQTNTVQDRPCPVRCPILFASQQVTNSR